MNDQGPEPDYPGSHLLDERDLLQLSRAEFSARYKVLGKLGTGAYADVLRVRDFNSKRDYALKVLQPGASHPGGLQADVALFREARALKHAKHRNVVELVRVLRLPTPAAAGLLRGTDTSIKRNSTSSIGGSTGDGSTWVLLMEYMQSGPLSRAIYKQMVNPQTCVYTDAAALTWAVDIAAGLAHLHSLSPCIIHRDLKLDNIMLQKQQVGSTAGGRSLPTAKITDFGLHVMLDVLPQPYLIKTVGGCPILLFGAELQQQQQHETLDGSCPTKKQSCSAECCSCNRSYTVGECMASTATKLEFNLKSSDTDIAPAATAALPHEIRATKHVMFSDVVQQQRQQRQQQPLGTGCGPNQKDNTTTCDKSALGLAAPQPGFREQEQQQQQQWQKEVAEEECHTVPLTTSALRRLSMDAMSSSGPSHIPIVLEAASNKPGSCASYCKASILSATLQRVSAPAAASLADAAATGTAGSSCSGNSGSADDRAGAHASLASELGSSAAAADGVAGGDVSSILAAANAERDYAVSIPGLVPISPGSRSRRPSTGGSSFAASNSRPRTPRCPSATPSVADSCGKSMSTRWSEWRPGSEASDASLLFQDGWQDDILQGDLGSEAPSCQGMATGLVYDLTHQTGSCMYMAPEIFRGDPYNESVDIFSFGVILYELFSRSLLLYTHTAANSPEDCTNYARRVANGFRPNRPKKFPIGVWQIVNRCWDASPDTRPSAAWVLQQLQQLLDAEEASAAAAKAAQHSKVCRALQQGRKLLQLNSLSFKMFGRETGSDLTAGPADEPIVGIAKVEDTAHAGTHAATDHRFSSSPPSVHVESSAVQEAAARPPEGARHARATAVVAAACKYGKGGAGGAAALSSVVLPASEAMQRVHGAWEVHSAPRTAATCDELLFPESSSSTTDAVAPPNSGDAKVVVPAPAAAAADTAATAAAVYKDVGCSAASVGRREELCGCVIC